MLNENRINIEMSCCGCSGFDLIANDTAKELVTHSLICTCNCEECTYVSQLLGKNLRLTGNEILEQERESGRYEKYSENFNEKRWEEIWPIEKCHTCGKDDVLNDAKSSPIHVTISSKDWTFCSRKCWKDAKNTKPALAFARAVGAAPGKSMYILNHFSSLAQVEHLRVVPRSFLGIMFYLSQSIQIPERDILKGKVTLTKNSDGGKFDWFDVTGELLTIRSSAEEPPRATVRVFYRDTWFYIDDTDLDSKSTFSLLTQIYALQSGAIKDVDPILTIGIGS